VLKSVALDIYRRLMNAVDPDLADTAEAGGRRWGGPVAPRAMLETCG
jgi:hypothetical protein